MSEHSRRTVVRGAAWSVPVIAVATQAPAFAVSPGTQGLRFDLACATTGGTNRGCNFPQALQVPIIITNIGPGNIVLVIDSMVTTRNANSSPVVTSTLSGQGVFATTGTNPNVANTCSTTIAPGLVNGKSSCGGIGSIIIGPSPNPQNFVIVSGDTGGSSNFTASISYTLRSADCQTVLSTGSGQTSGAISPQNCAVTA